MKYGFSVEELSKLYIMFNNFVKYVKENDKRKLPRCFDYCNTIIHNIEICKSNNWDDIEELSLYINQDWNSAMEIHTGLPEYYIPNEVFQIQKRTNKIIGNYIVEIGKIIELKNKL